MFISSEIQINNCIDFLIKAHLGHSNEFMIDFLLLSWKQYKAGEGNNAEVKSSCVYTTVVKPR